MAGGTIYHLSPHSQRVYTFHLNKIANVTNHYQVTLVYIIPGTTLMTWMTLNDTQNIRIKDRYMCDLPRSRVLLTLIATN